jgi:hypothetical protein
LVETHRRGLKTAQQVAAVTDAAEWIQTVIELHRPDATRILDFPHAAQRISQIGQLALDPQAPESATWLTDQLHTLKHAGPAEVLAQLPLFTENLAYLEKRQAQMQYPTFQAQSWPIGSGSVESANKLVVEARLKGAGMHWSRSQVNPMLALHNVVCNDRWREAWPQIADHLCRQAALKRRQLQSSVGLTFNLTPLHLSLPHHLNLIALPPIILGVAFLPIVLSFVLQKTEPHPLKL